MAHIGLTGRSQPRLRCLRHPDDMTTTISQPRPTAQQAGSRRSAPQRPVRGRRVRDVRRPSRWAGNVAALAAGVGAGVTIATCAPALSSPALNAPGGLVNALGIVAAMLGTYLALLALVLMARLPFLEREVGQDRITAWHRLLGPWTLVLIASHVLLTTLGYAQSEGVNVIAEAIRLVFGYPWMLPAAVAFLAMVGLGVISYRRIRRRMSYETWHVAHMMFYLAIALAFGHQIETGSIFFGHPWARDWWIGLYVAVAAAIVIFRVLVPVVRSARHDLRVSAVVPVDDETVHVYVTGRNLHRLRARGGQWFTWRFATRHWWWQGHPYSLSAVPTDTVLRITVRALGDQSGTLTRLRPGTRVFIEGPYGAFRSDRRYMNKVLLIGAGIGMAPVRALARALPRGVQADIIYRSHDVASMPLAEELIRIADESDGAIRLHLQPGSRYLYPVTPQHLGQLIPDIAERDVYACGPVGFLDDLQDSCRALGVPNRRFHAEDFEF